MFSNKRQLVVVHRDAAGRRAQQWLYTIDSSPPDVSGEAGLISAINALTTAGYAGVLEQRGAVESNFGGPGAYSKGGNVAQFCFRSMSGRAVYLDVPSPIESMFLTGSREVDQANAEVETLIEQAMAELADEEGGAMDRLLWARRNVVGR